jgi:hypothetical protein
VKKRITLTINDGDETDKAIAALRAAGTTPQAVIRGLLADYAKKAGRKGRSSFFFHKGWGQNRTHTTCMSLIR